MGLNRMLITIKWEGGKEEGGEGDVFELIISIVGASHRDGFLHRGEPELQPPCPLQV